MYWRLFVKPIAWLVLAMYLSFWVGNAEQLGELHEQIAAGLPFVQQGE